MYLPILHGRKLGLIAACEYRPQNCRYFGMMSQARLHVVHKSQSLMSTTIALTNLKKEVMKPRSGDALLQYRTLLIVLSQLLFICVSYYYSFVLRLDVGFDASQHSLFWHSLPWVIAIKLLVFYRFGLLRGWWRYVGMSDLLDIASASLVAAVMMFGLFVFLLPRHGYPRSVVPIDMLLSMMLIGGARFGVR